MVNLNMERGMDYISMLDEDQKVAYMTALAHLAHADGEYEIEEDMFIKEVAELSGIPFSRLDEITTKISNEELKKILAKITDKKVAYNLLREMCVLSHADSELTDDEMEVLAISAEAMGVDLEKLEEISSWVIRGLIWKEEAAIIFDEE